MRAVAARSGPSPCASSTFTPSIRSSTSTRSVTYGRITSGTTSSSCSSTSRLITSALWASSTRSSSSRRCASSSSVSASSWSSCAVCEWPSSSFAVERSTSRSSSTCSTIPGRRTLTTTRRPVFSSAAMDLGDRRGGERLGLDLGERLEPELLRDHGLDQRVGHRLDLVDELAELLDVDVGKQVGARGEQLPELDVRGAELLERAAKLDRTLAGGRLVADDADLGEHAQEARPPRDARHLERAPPAAGAGSHRRGVSCPGYVRNRRTAASSSRSETAPSNFALILPSRPTRNTHGSVGSFHSWTHRFTPSAGLFSL